MPSANTEDGSLTDSIDDAAGSAIAAAGLVQIWCGRRATLSAIDCPVDAPCVIGREGPALALDDKRASRRHAEVTRTAAGAWRIRDLASHNGTHVDGEAITGEVTVAAPRVVRIGDTLLAPVADVRRYRRGAIELADGVVVGPTLRAAYDAIAIAARTGGALHLTGETGAGKELAARRFHADAAARGPFIAVNCAAIPAQLAESLLFGVKKGAYSGADADRDGFYASADGGTLFLDEIGELSLDIQAKLLRTVETGEVVTVGATRPRAAAVRLCTATHQDLRARVGAGGFRQDLYYRIGRPTVAVPPLRERLEDLPYLALAAVARVAPALELAAATIEQLLLRPWPGNARELLGEVADAAARALAAGAAVVGPDWLADDAGMPIPSAAPAAGGGEASPRTVADVDAQAIADALAKANGNVSAAARSLGLHRTQLRRYLANK